MRLASKSRATDGQRRSSFAVWASFLSLSAFLVSILHSQVAGDGPGAGVPLSTAIVGALEDHRIVALGENHGHAQFHRLLLETLADPAVAAHVDDLVIEWGNARYQDLVDNYVAGGSAALADLRPVWRNTVSSPSPVWESPVYSDFFDEVRKLNQQRDDGRSYRVLLAGPAVHWDQVADRADLAASGTLAESIFAVVQREVLRPGRRALVVAGGAHASFANMVRTRSNGLRVAEVTPLSKLQLHFPGSVYAIRSMGLAGPGYDSNAMVDAVPGTVVVVAGALAALPANGITRMRNADGTPFGLYGDQTLGDMVDAIIVWGPEDAFERSEPDLCKQFDESWWQELARRSRIVAGRDLTSSWRAACGSA